MPQNPCVLRDFVSFGACPTSNQSSQASFSPLWPKSTLLNFKSALPGLKSGLSGSISALPVLYCLKLQIKLVWPHISTHKLKIIPQGPQYSTRPQITPLRPQPFQASKVSNQSCQGPHISPHKPISGIEFAFKIAYSCLKTLVFYGTLSPLGPAQPQISPLRPHLALLGLNQVS